MASARKFLRMVWILFCLSHGSAVFCQEPEEKEEPKKVEQGGTVRLLVGKTVMIETEKSQHLQVSKRGIVFVHQVNPTLLSITGTTKGFVVIEGRAESGNFHFFVEVMGQEDKNYFLPTNKNSGLELTPWQDYCDDIGIACQSNRVTGTLNHPKDFYHGKKLCEADPVCLWQVKLSDKGQKSLRQTLEHIFPGFMFSMTREGFIHLQLPCEEKNAAEKQKELQQRLQPTLGDLPLTVTCLATTAPTTYYLQMKLVLLQDAARELSGGQGTLDLNVEMLDLKYLLAADTRLNPQKTDVKAQVIGEPEILLQPHTTATIKSGGEFPVTTSRYKTKSVNPENIVWKEYGFHLECTLMPQTDQQLEFLYKFFMRQKLDDDGELSLNQMEGKVRLAAEQGTIIGIADLKASDESVDLVPFLAATPIIGPLFKTTSKTNVSNHVALWVKATPLADHAQRDATQRSLQSKFPQ